LARWPRGYGPRPDTIKAIAERGIIHRDISFRKKGKLMIPDIVDATSKYMEGFVYLFRGLALLEVLKPG
jgi:hypothetical protein